MNNRNSLSFWIFTLLVMITILNDRLALYNMVFSPIYVFFCMYYAVKVIPQFKVSFYLLLFSLIYFAYVIISPNIVGGLNSKWGMLNWELKVMLTFFPAYYFAKKEIVTSKQLRIVGVLFLIVAIVSYYLNINSVILNREYDEEGLTNNVGYLFVAIIPLLLANVRKNFIFIIIAYIFILASLKRGAIVCGLATIPFLIYLCRSQFHINKNVILFFLIVLSFGVAYLIQGAMRSNEYVEKRIEMTLEGNSSGRDDHIKDILYRLEEFDAVDMITGRGINYSMKMIGGFAHNDWLELLSSMGIIGCFSYLLTFWVLYLSCKKYCNAGYKVIGSLIILLIFMRTMISMNYFSLDSIPFYYTLGLICYRKELNESSSLHGHIQ